MPKQRRRRLPSPAVFKEQGSELELAWAAGFWDGEGSFGCYLTATNAKGCVKATISQKDPQVLERFRDAVGMGRIGQVEPKRPMYHWYLTRQLSVVRLVALLWPYLSTVKREQMTATLALYTEARY